MLAYPYSAYSAKGGLGRAQAVPHGCVFFLGFHGLSQARHTMYEVHVFLQSRAG